MLILTPVRLHIIARTGCGASTRILLEENREPPPDTLRIREAPPRPEDEPPDNAAKGCLSALAFAIAFWAMIALAWLVWRYVR